MERDIQELVSGKLSENEERTVDLQFEQFVVSEFREGYADYRALLTAFRLLREQQESDGYNNNTDFFAPMSEELFDNVSTSAGDTDSASESLNEPKDERRPLISKKRRRHGAERRNSSAGHGGGEGGGLLGGIVRKLYGSQGIPRDAQELLLEASDLYKANVDKVDKFYREHLDSYRRESELLRHQWEHKDQKLSAARAARPPMKPTKDRVADSGRSAARSTSKRKPPLPKSVEKQDQETETAVRQEAASIRRGYIDVYRHLKFLEAFSGLNNSMLTGLVRELSPTLLNYLHTKSFVAGDELSSLIRDVERTYANFFFSGSLVEARMALLIKQTNSAINGPHFAFGIQLGVCVMLAVWLVWDAVVDNAQFWKSGNLVATPAFPVFRGMFAVVLLVWAWGVSCYVWTSSRINYIYMFQLDPRTVPSLMDVFNDATVITVVYFIMMLLYYKAMLGTLPLWVRPGVYPLILCTYVFFKLIGPGSRPFLQNLARTGVQVVCSPLTQVTFFSIFLGDWMTSLVKAEADLAYSVCYFARGVFLRDMPSRHSKVDIPNDCEGDPWLEIVINPLVSVLPLWFRIMQCLRRVYDTGERNPHLLNALKYSLAMIVVLLGAFHPFSQQSGWLRAAWLVLFCSSGLYSFVWDVCMDWGLGQIRYGFLAESRMYPKRGMYYAAIVADFFLRFSWVLTLAAPGTVRAFLQMSLHPQAMLYLMAPTIIEYAELMRRTMWSFFRLENEQLRNTLKFRSSKFIPLHFEKVYAAETEHSGSHVNAVELVFFATMVAAFAVIVVLSRFMST